VNNDHKKIKELIAASFDGELDAAGRSIVEEHIKSCAQCRRVYEEMSRFEEVMNQMELQKPSRDTWKYYWDSVYNRLERRAGWILFSIGVMILLFFGGYKGLEGLIADPGIPFSVSRFSSESESDTKRWENDYCHNRSDSGLHHSENAGAGPRKYH